MIRKLIMRAGLMFKQSRASESGASLVFALFLMLFLTLISFSLVRLITHETKSSTKLHLSQQALYAAEAGVERKIAQLKEDITGAIALTDFYGAQYEVSVTAAGDKRYEILSTGYVSTKASAKEKRAVQVVVLVESATPEHALAFAGQGTIESNITIYGTIRSNDKITIGSNITITESSPGKGDASIFSAWDPQDDDTTAIDIGSNFHVGVSGQFFKCRNNSLSAPDSHAPKTSDGTNQIYDEDNIVEKYNVTIVENDNSSDTDPLEVPSVDIDALLEDAVEVTTSNYKTVLNAGANTPWVLENEGYADVQFSIESNKTWNPNNTTYNFTKGIRANSKVTIGPDAGTLIISAGEGEHGIEINSNIPAPGGDPVELNLIVSGGTWSEEDIKINSNIELIGYVYGSADIDVNSNVEITGILESGGNVSVKSNIKIRYSDDIPLNLPWKEGFGGSVTIVSWQEVSP